MKINLIQVGTVLLATLLAGCVEEGPGDADGQVRVTSQPEGAIVELDGIQHDITPVTIENVGPGDHLVTLRKEGYRDTRQTLSLLPGQRVAVDMKMEEETGLVLVHSNPSGADISIDEAYRGKTPLLITDFPLGTHRITAQQDGFQEREVELTMEDRSPKKIDVELVSDTAILDVRSVPPGARVMVNGSERGTTPATIPGIRTGDSVVEVLLEGYFEFQDRVNLRAGETRDISARLRPKPSSLRIVSVPEAGRVYVNNEFEGITPLSMSSIDPGDYRIRVELKGFASESRTVSIAPTDQRTEEFRLARNSGIVMLVTEPSAVKVFVDGRYVGITKAKPGETDVVSESLAIDVLETGTHTLQLTKKGFTYEPKTISVTPEKVVNLHEKMERMFIPDTMVRVGTGPDDVHTGRLVAKHPNGDIEIEVRRGVIVNFDADTVLHVRPILQHE